MQQVTCKKGGAVGTQISQLGYLYDSSGRVTHETQKHGALAAKTIKSIFFDALNKNQLEHPNGTVVEYRRNELGQLHQIAKNNVVVKENTFVGGKQARIQRGPLTQSLVYGNGNEMLSSKYQNGNQTIVDYTLGYNKVYYKNFEKRNHESGLGDRYKYDSVYHLIETAYDAPLPEINANGYVKKEAVEYSNTDFRNSIIKFDSLGIIDQKHYIPNALHQAVAIHPVPSVGPFNRIYNRNGNLTQNENSDLYEFDYANKLVKVSTKDANNLPIDVIFTYDCSGRKIQKTVTQTNTNTVVTDEHYYYSGEEVIAEYNGADVLQRSYVLGERLDIPVSVTDGSYDFYFVYDTHGSVIAITNASGAIEERYKYDAHGNFEILIDSQWVNNRYFYAARDWEAEIKLYNNRARFYDPQNGFFIQRDPLGYVDGSNPYIYTAGNSVNYTDPLGMSIEDEKRTYFAHEIKDKEGNVTDVHFQAQGVWYKIKSGGDYKKDKDGFYNFDSKNTITIGPEELPKVPTAATRLKDFLDANLDEATKNQLGVLARVYGDEVAVNAMQAAFDSGNTSLADLVISQTKAQKDHYVKFAKENPKTAAFMVVLTVVGMGKFKNNKLATMSDKVSLKKGEELAEKTFDSLQPILNAKSKFGNFNIGKYSRDQIDTIGLDWVGPNARKMGDIGWISQDGLKTYRFPKVKTNTVLTKGQTQGNLTEYVQDEVIQRNGTKKIVKRELRNAHMDLEQ